MRKVISGVLAALLLVSVGLVATAPPATAFEGWEGSDPVISVNGQTFSLVVGVWGERSVLSRKVHEADITIMVPAGSHPAVVRMMPSVFKEDVHFVEIPNLGQGQSKTVYILVRFDADGNFPARLMINGALEDQGNTRGILHGSFRLR